MGRCCFRSGTDSPSLSETTTGPARDISFSSTVAHVGVTRYSVWSGVEVRRVEREGYGDSLDCAPSSSEREGGEVVDGAVVGGGGRGFAFSEVRSILRPRPRRFFGSSSSTSRTGDMLGAELRTATKRSLGCHSGVENDSVDAVTSETVGKEVAAVTAVTTVDWPSVADRLCPRVDLDSIEPLSYLAPWPTAEVGTSGSTPEMEDNCEDSCESMWSGILGTSGTMVRFVDALDLFDFIDLFVPRETLETVLELTDAACRDRASKSADQMERRCSSNASPNAEQAGLTLGCLPDLVETLTRLSKLRRRWRGLDGGTSESDVEGLLLPAAAVLGRGGGRGPPNPVAAASSSVCSGDAELRLTSLARHSRAARCAGLTEDFDDDDTFDDGAAGRWVCLEYGDEAARTPRNDDLRGDKLVSRVALARRAADSGDRDGAGGVRGVSITSEPSSTGDGTPIPLPRFVICDADRVGCRTGRAVETPALAIGWVSGAGRGCVDDVEGPSIVAADRFKACAPLDEPSLDKLPFRLSDRGIMDAATLPV